MDAQDGGAHTHHATHLAAHTCALTQEEVVRVGVLERGDDGRTEKVNIGKSGARGSVSKRKWREN